MLLKRQEIIEFNPANKDHRAAVRAFLKRRAWMDSPLRFAYDPSYGSVAEQVQAKLLEWYVAQEEAKESKKPTQLRSRKTNSEMIQSAGKLPSFDDAKTLAFQMMGIASELPKKKTT